MGRITTYGLLVTALAVLPAGAHAQATNYVSNVNPSGNWNSPGSWIPSGVPNAANGDTATILAGDTITVTDARSAASVTVNGTGVLQINNAGALTLATATVNSGGALLIDGCDASVAELLFPSNATSPSLTINATNGVRLADNSRIVVAKTMSFGGSGSLQGLDSDAAIVLLPGFGQDLYLTTDVLIHGALVIKESGAGKGYFFNANEVRADVPGILQLDASLDGIDDDASGSCSQWTVNASGAVLRFNSAATGLDGGFHVGPGRLDVNQPVSTSGLRFTHGGTIAASWPACFSFGGHCGSDCWWIQSPVCQTVHCR